jgi:hypothetical protein
LLASELAPGATPEDLAELRRQGRNVIPERFVEALDLVNSVMPGSVVAGLADKRPVGLD